MQQEVRSLISFDVGIKNLSFCYFARQSDAQPFDISMWDNIDLTRSSSANVEKLICNAKKNGRQCTAAAKFYHGDSLFCAKHAKAQTSMVVPFFKPTNLASKKLDVLKELAAQCKLSIEGKKSDFVGALETFAKERFLSPVVEAKAVDATKLDMATIGRNLMEKMDALLLEPVDLVIIENQIGPLASKMKAVQAMLTQYFIMRNNPRIEFISAGNKLSQVSTDGYKDRKKTSIAITLEQVSESWRSFLSQHKKKDDLCDCYLQGRWYIERHLVLPVPVPDPNPVPDPVVPEYPTWC